MGKPVKHEKSIVPCDFCGSVQRLRHYPADARGVVWHSCEICATFIRNEDWDKLIERIIAAYAALQYISESEQGAFRHELENAFRHRVKDAVDVSNTFCLLPA
jgi:hypothetical protein